MISSWQDSILIFFRTTAQILTAGVAITAFALLLYALTFNLRDRVTRCFAIILTIVVLVFSADALGSSTGAGAEIAFWLKGQWVGIILLPPAYLHFSDALLATTGKPSRWRRYWAVRFSYVISVVFLGILVSRKFVGPLVVTDLPAAYLQPTLFTAFFLIFYVVVMALSWVNFVRAYRRTTTMTSRRRMAYLILGALAPTFGSFPFLLFGSGFVVHHPLIFWILAAVSNLLVGGLIIVMAYSVAFFGVTWPDRVVKSRLFKWIVRGPALASFTLGLVTIVRRLGEAFGSSYSALVPITMVITILTGQYLITLFSPLWDRMFFFGEDRKELHLLRNLEDRLLTRNDLHQFIEMALAAVRDRLQAPGAYVAALDGDHLELIITSGKAEFSSDGVSEQLSRLMSENGGLPQLFLWGEDYLVPLRDAIDEEEWELIGLLGVAGVGENPLDADAVKDLRLLADRVTLALRDRRVQQQVMASLHALTPQIDIIQRFRAASRYDGQHLLEAELPENLEISQLVKEALTHYWGGPKLTESPLIALRVVQQALEDYDGNSANALRAILKQAVEKTRPEGERRFTAEWILYNILDMKFLEGRKVREVAARLAVSEADLYRKQRIAIEAVAKAILDMESQARGQMLEQVRP